HFARMSALPVEVTYRVAESLDHEIVVAMLRELVDELGPSDTAPRIKLRLDGDIRAALESADVRIFLAEKDGDVIGLSRGDILTGDPIFRLRDDRRCGYVDQMFVRPAYRSTGVGAHLLGLCEDWFREKGIGHALLHAAPRAVRFYAREGYQPNREMFKRL
ncbi:MAG: GNAT family N-acetyltransferase, partial [Myxococcota bacterium]